MNDQSYTTTISVDQSPEEAFAAITNARGWWSEQIDGPTDALGAEFTYRYQDVHRASFRITELVPGKRVVWNVLDNYFNFVKDRTEWIGTDIVFDIDREDDRTVVTFTHVGLWPGYECYDICSDAWHTYITGSLRDLIVSGRGQPNPIDDVVARANALSEQAFTTSFVVDQSPDEVFAAVNDVRGWWSEEIDGRTHALGAEFTFRHDDLHRSVQRITEFVPVRKVVWHVTDSDLAFVDDRQEWTGTDIVFEITPKGGRTELRFTHVGLVPACDCYGDCSGAWGYYINDSLRSLVTTGTGNPARAVHRRGEVKDRGTAVAAN